jgi:hypothetical protein
MQKPSRVLTVYNYAQNWYHRSANSIVTVCHNKVPTYHNNFQRTNPGEMQKGEDLIKSLCIVRQQVDNLTQNNFLNCRSLQL